MKQKIIANGGWLTVIVSLFMLSACGDDDGGTLLDGGFLTDTDGTDTDTDGTDTDTDGTDTDTDGTDTDTDGTDTDTDGEMTDTDGEMTDMDGGPGDGGMPSTLTDVIADNPDLSTLEEALATADLDETLAGDGPFTVFAPTNSAFDLLPEGLIESLSAEDLGRVLRFHVVEGETRADDLDVDTELDTLVETDQTLRVSFDGTTAYLNGLTEIVETDIQTDNGIIHIIDSVLMPGPFPGNVNEVLNSYPRLGPLAQAVEEAELESSLDDDGLTLFAPVSSAFEGVTLPEGDDLSELITYHGVSENISGAVVAELATAQTLSGGFVVVRASEEDGVRLYDGTAEAAVIYADIAVDGELGSTIHLLDRVLTPPPSIVEVAAEADLNELVSLMDETIPGQAETFAELLGAPGTYTLFGPTDAAFEGVSGQLGADLDEVLAAHVVASAVDSTSIEAAIDELDWPVTLTSRGDVLTFSLVDDSLLVDSMVTVTVTDMPASNGIVHAIDGIILPIGVEFPGTIVEALAAYPQLSAISAAVDGTATAGVLGASGSSKTFFAPYDFAFDGVTLPSGEDDMETLLSHHLVEQALAVSDIQSMYSDPGNVTTAAGEEVMIDGTYYTVGGAAMLRFDVLTENGIIHIIDDVLIPSSLEQDGGDAGVDAGGDGG